MIAIPPMIWAARIVSLATIGISRASSCGPLRWKTAAPRGPPSPIAHIFARPLSIGAPNVRMRLDSVDDDDRVRCEGTRTHPDGHLPFDRRDALGLGARDNRCIHRLRIDAIAGEHFALALGGRAAVRTHRGDHERLRAPLADGDDRLAQRRHDLIDAPATGADADAHSRLDALQRARLRERAAHCRANVADHRLRGVGHVPHRRAAAGCHRGSRRGRRRRRRRARHGGGSSRSFLSRTTDRSATILTSCHGARYVANLTPRPATALPQGFRSMESGGRLMLREYSCPRGGWSTQEGSSRR